MLAFLCLSAQGPDQVSPRLLPSLPAEEQRPGARSGRRQGTTSTLEAGTLSPWALLRGLPTPLEPWGPRPGAWHTEGHRKCRGREAETRVLPNHRGCIYHVFHPPGLL